VIGRWTQRVSGRGTILVIEIMGLTAAMIGQNIGRELWKIGQ
jgi:hypothetical protein